jgi:nucleoside-diphosphate-sugar epimerase
VIGGNVKPTYAEPRQGDVRDSQADIQRAKDLLGYKPIVSFEEGLKRTIDWYRGAHAIATA